MNQVVTAKATAPNEYSGAIVVSFDARWLDPITRCRLKAVLRKRVPRTLVPKWIYFYVNSPVNQIVGRARIKTVESIGLSAALLRSRDLCIGQDEIRAYLVESKSAGLYIIGRIELAKPAISLADLRKELMFYPPQSFLFLSPPAKNIIDRLAQL